MLVWNWMLNFFGNHWGFAPTEEPRNHKGFWSMMNTCSFLTVTQHWCSVWGFVSPLEGAPVQQSYWTYTWGVFFTLGPFSGLSIFCAYVNTDGWTHTPVGCEPYSGCHPRCSEYDLFVDASTKCLSHDHSCTLYACGGKNRKQVVPSADGHLITWFGVSGVVRTSGVKGSVSELKRLPGVVGKHLSFKSDAAAPGSQWRECSSGVLLVCQSFLHTVLYASFTSDGFRWDWAASTFFQLPQPSICSSVSRPSRSRCLTEPVARAVIDHRSHHYITVLLIYLYLFKVLVIITQEQPCVSLQATYFTPFPQVDPLRWGRDKMSATRLVND